MTVLLLGMRKLVPYLSLIDGKIINRMSKKLLADARVDVRACDKTGFVRLFLLNLFIIRVLPIHVNVYTVQ